MKIRIIIITIYHSQFNSQLEHTNQTAEVVLQYVLKDISDADFTDFLSAFKQIFNNSINTFTDQTFNEIIYEFNFADFFNVISDSNVRKFEAEYKIHQQETQDLIA